jgi:hypothetical protein
VSSSKSKWWAVFLGVFVVEVILLVKLLTSQATTELLFSIGVVTLLLVLTLSIDRLIGISFSADGLEAKLSEFKEKIEDEVHEVGDKIKTKVDRLGNDISTLGDDINSLLISTVLDAFEYITLKKITGQEENDDYDFNPKGQDLLERLRNRGLIDEVAGLFHSNR